MAGTKGAKSDKEWRDAIRLAVNEVRKGPDGSKAKKVLRQLARKLVDRALDGDIAALKEIGDRLDGKPVQALVGGGEDDPPIAVVRHLIVDPEGK